MWVGRMVGVLLLGEQQHEDDDDDESADADVHVSGLPASRWGQTSVSRSLTEGTNALMMAFFILLIVLMVLIAVCIPMFNGGGGRRIYVDRRRPMYDDDVEIVEDVDEVSPRPIARRRVYRRRGY